MWLEFHVTNLKKRFGEPEFDLFLYFFSQRE